MGQANHLPPVIPVAREQHGERLLVFGAGATQQLLKVGGVPGYGSPPTRTTGRRRPLSTKRARRQVRSCGRLFSDRETR
jgi:hypothetical protein